MATLVSQPPHLHLPQSKTPTLCNKPRKSDSVAFKEKKHFSVDYDSGTHHLSTHISDFRKRDIPKHHRLRDEMKCFQKDWAVSNIVNRIYQLSCDDDIDGELNQWVGRFTKKNFPILIREMTESAVCKCFGDPTKPELSRCPPPLISSSSSATSASSRPTLVVDRAVA